MRSRRARATPAPVAAGAHTVAGVFEERALAERAINDLVRDGLARDRIGVVARDEVFARAVPGGFGPRGEKMPPDEAARVAGLDLSAEPGMGSLLAIGPVGALLAGTVPLATALTRLGMPSTEAARCAAHVQRGAVLIVAEAGPSRAEAARQRLRDAGAVDVIDGVQSS